MMNDVEPFAATLRSVWRDCNTKATNMNVQRAHQPGNSPDDGHADVSAKMALAVVKMTSSVVFLFRGIALDKGRNPGPAEPLVPVLPFTSTDQSGEKSSD